MQITVQKRKQKDKENYKIILEAETTIQPLADATYQYFSDVAKDMTNSLDKVTKIFDMLDELMEGDKNDKS